MTRLEALKQRVQALPDRQRHANHVGVLDQFRAKVAQARQDLEDAMVRRGLVGDVFPTVTVPRSASAIAEAARVARDLAERLEIDLSAVETPETEGKVRTVAEKAKAARSAVWEDWRSAMLRRVSGFDALVRVAKDARLPGGEQLALKLDGLRTVDPPLNPEVARRIKNLLDDLERQVEGLGLDDAVGRFLRDALQGKGDARALARAEVKAFLDRHEFWDRLSVRFG